MMRKSAGYKWNDGMCDQSFRALCETAPVSYYLMVQCCFLFITVQPPYFAPPGGHKIKTAKQQRYSLLRGIHTSRHLRHKRNAFNSTNTHQTQCCLAKNCQIFEGYMGVSDASCFIFLVFFALSSIISAARSKRQSFLSNSSLETADLDKKCTTNIANSRWHPRLHQLTHVLRVDNPLHSSSSSSFWATQGYRD